MNDARISVLNAFIGVVGGESRKVISVESLFLLPGNIFFQDKKKLVCNGSLEEVRNVEEVSAVS